MTEEVVRVMLMFLVREVNLEEGISVGGSAIVVFLNLLAVGLICI